MISDVLTKIPNNYIAQDIVITPDDDKQLAPMLIGTVAGLLFSPRRTIQSFKSHAIAHYHLRNAETYVRNADYLNAKASLTTAAVHVKLSGQFEQTFKYLTLRGVTELAQESNLTEHGIQSFDEAIELLHNKMGDGDLREDLIKLEEQALGLKVRALKGLGRDASAELLKIENLKKLTRAIKAERWYLDNRGKGISQHDNFLRELTAAERNYSEAGEVLHTARIFATRGEYLTAYGDLSEALRNYDRAITLYKESGKLLFAGFMHENKARIFLKMGDKKSAGVEFKAAIEYFPYNAMWPGRASDYNRVKSALSNLLGRARVEVVGKSDSPPLLNIAVVGKVKASVVQPRGSLASVDALTKSVEDLAIRLTFVPNAHDKLELLETLRRLTGISLDNKILAEALRNRNGIIFKTIRPHLGRAFSEGQIEALAEIYDPSGRGGFVEKLRRDRERRERHLRPR